MELPLEKTISTAIEQIAKGVEIKVSQIEESKKRDFTLQMKELEFYKSNYEKDLKSIFDYWFELVMVTILKDNKNLTEQEKIKYVKKYNDFIKVDKMMQIKMKTLKYGGEETGRILALQNKLQQEKYSDQPEYTNLYIWCSLLAIIKCDILGQYINPTDIMQVLTNDFDNYIDEIKDTQKYISKIYKDVYKEEPNWMK